MPAKLESDPLELGEGLRRAREHAGLSRRGLASALGRSLGTVIEAERGRDIRHSTLVQYLEALPDLAPRELLPVAEAEGPMDRHEAWAYQRELLGIEAERVEREWTIRSDGSSEDVLSHRGVRWLRGGTGEVRVLHGLERAIFGNAPSFLREVQVECARDPEGDEVKSRLISHRDDMFLHQLSIPAHVARVGLSYSRTKVREGVSLTAEESRRRRGVSGDDPVVVGLSFDPTYPVRELRLAVRFPAGYWPAVREVFVWPGVFPPDPDMENLRDVLHPEGLPLTEDRAEGMLACRVERPLMGFSYGFGWELP